MRKASLILFEDERQIIKRLNNFKKEFPKVCMLPGTSRLKTNEFNNFLLSFKKTYSRSFGPDFLSLNGIDYWESLVHLFFIRNEMAIEDWLLFGGNIRNIFQKRKGENLYVTSFRKHRIEMIKSYAKTHRIKLHVLHPFKHQALKGSNNIPEELVGAISLIFTFLSTLKNKLISKRRYMGYKGTLSTVFLPRTENHLHDLIPIAKDLRKRYPERSQTILLAGTSADICLGINTKLVKVYRKLRKERLKIHFVDEGISLTYEDITSYLHAFQRIGTKVSDFANEWASYIARNMGFEVPQFLVRDLKICILQVLLYHMPMGLLMDRFVSVHKPKLLVKFGCCKPYSAMIGMVGEKHEIPVLFVPHSYVLQEGPATQIHCDLITVPGDSDAFSLRKMGVPEEKIVITGRPNYDRFISGSIHKNSSLRRINKILIASQQSEFSRGLVDIFSKIKFKESIAAAAEKFTDKQFIWKLHPLEVLDKKLIPENENNISIVKDVDLFKLIESCDLLITISSDVGVGAIIMGKPVISLNFGGEKPPYVKEGAAIEVRNKEELIHAIRRLQTKGVDGLKMERYREKVVGKIDGKSAQRIVDLMIKLMNINR